MNIFQQQLPQTTPPASTMKPPFSHVVFEHDIDYHQLQDIAKENGIDDGIMNDMFLGVAIHRVDAKKYLAAFSAYVNKEYTLDTVKVALLPTFQELCDQHRLDTAKISTLAKVPHAVLDMMSTDKPVAEHYATSVLKVVTYETKRNYSLKNIDVALLRR
jgi:hypothetical protein